MRPFSVAGLPIRSPARQILSPSPAGSQDGSHLAVELCAVQKRYERDKAAIAALRPLDLVVPDGQFLIVRGASGSGKSTLLRLIAGMERASSGRICLFGRDLSSLDSRALDIFRRDNIGMALQSSLLVRNLTVRENVGLPLLLAGRRDEAAKGAVESMLDALGIGNLAGSEARLLSRGEARRVALARALVHDPRLVLADEPTMDLDRRAIEPAMQALRGYRCECRRGVIVVSNDPDVTVYADRVIELAAGAIVADNGEIRGIRSGTSVA